MRKGQPGGGQKLGPAQVAVDRRMRAGQQSEHQAVHRESHPEADQRRQQQGQQHLGHAGEVAVQHSSAKPQTTWSAPTATTTAPANAADQRVRGRGGYAVPPGQQIPADGAEQATQNNG